MMMKKKLIHLRPTQHAVGLKEVQTKIAKLKSLSEKEIEEHLNHHPVPVIQYKDDGFHIIDHHHLVRACWELGIEHVIIKIIEDLSHLSPDHFWKKMEANHWVHPYDQFGNGPHSPSTLPFDIRGLADDPFRSLAWAVREAGGFSKSEEPFSEFKWADFFRKKITIEKSENGFKNAAQEAISLSQSHEAKSLPGFISKK